MALSLCIVGCGNYARTAVQVICDVVQDVELYFASRDLQKAKDYCATYGGVDSFGSYEQAAQDPRVEAMYFFTPHHLHLDNVLLAARHSKHVMVEKPIARTIGEARQMVQAAKDARINLMVAENYRFLPAVHKSKQLIEQGELGDLRLIEIHSEGYAQLTGWRTKAEFNGGGMFIDGGIHSVDILVNLGGFPERLYALEPPKVLGHMEGEDGLVMIGHLPKGCVGLINFSGGTSISQQRQQVEITGTVGHLMFAPNGNELVVDTAERRRTVRLPDANKGIQGMVEEFRDSIQESREPEMSAEEGIKDLAVVLGAYESVNQGRAVPLALP